jgi:hypothetical protein
MQRQAPQRRFVTSVGWLLEVLFLLLLIVVLTGLVPHLAPALYLTALTFVLLQAAIVFLQLVRSLLVNSEHD